MPTYQFTSGSAIDVSCLLPYIANIFGYKTVGGRYHLGDELHWIFIGVHNGYPYFQPTAGGVSIWWDSSGARWVMSSELGVPGTSYYTGTQWGTQMPTTAAGGGWEPCGSAVIEFTYCGFMPMPSVDGDSAALATAASVAAIPTTAAPSASTIAAAVWDRLLTALTTAGSIGKKLADWVIGSPLQADDARLPSSGTIAVQGEYDTVLTTIGGTASNIGDDVDELLVRIPNGDPGAEGGLPVLDADLEVAAKAAVTLSPEDIAAISEGITPPTVDPQVVRDAMLKAPTEGATVEAGSLDQLVGNVQAALAGAEVSVVSPVTSALDMLVTRYDDYLDADGLAFTWTSTDGAWCGGSLSGWTVTWTATTLSGVVVLTKACIVHSAVSPQDIRLELTSANTGLFTNAGKLYKYQILFSKTGHRQTRIEGDIVVSDALSVPA